MNKNSIIETITAILVFLFLYTALSKYTDLGAFKYSLSQSPLLNKFVGFIAIVLPAAEILTVVFLIIPKTRLKGLYISAGLLSAFTLYLTGMLMFSKDLPCGCGGVISSLSWKQHIFFNLFFILISILGIRLYRKVSNESNITHSSVA